jgi:predicted Rossmann fold flavoprotein
MGALRVAIVGGGAAGVFAAVSCAEARPDAAVTVLEKGAQPLAKVRISGGGRCNVTHACLDATDLVEHYPRGGRALLGPLRAFGPHDTVTWFAAHGVKLKTEADGRMFPVTDRSATVVDCLLDAARRAGVVLRTGCAVSAVAGRPGGGFTLALGGETLECDRLLLATGGCRTESGGALAAALGHRLEPPVPSLFTFHVETAWVRSLAGVSADPVEVSVPGTTLHARGPLLLTHQGVSGPAVLRLSAWGARVFHDRDYRFPVRIDWLADLGEPGVTERLRAARDEHPARLVANTPIPPLAARLWERLVEAAGIAPGTRWAELSRRGRQRLAETLVRTELPVSGRSLNKDEFVTCGGVPLGEVDLRTMASRQCPGLHLAGELLDVDGVTGGFNFQWAWASGWLAGRAMAAGGGA